MKRQISTLKNDRSYGWLFWIALISIAALGMYLLWRATPFGLGLVNDSAAYVGGADSLSAGNGYTRESGGGELKPITHFPPFFSIILAIFRFTGGEFIEIAHIQILVLFGLGIFLAGWLTVTLTHSRIFGILAAFLLASSDTILEVYVALLSEPLFVVLMLVAMFTFAKYYDQKKNRWMLITGVILGLAYLTRFAALSLIAAFLIAMALLARPRSLLRSGFWQPVIALLAGAAPFLASWSIYNWWTTGIVGNRQLVLHLIPAATLFNGMKNLLSWLAPQKFLAIHPIFGWGLSGLSLISPVVMLGIILWLWRSKQEKFSPELAILAVLTAHILVYLIFLMTSISLFDASTPLDNRILLVIYVPEMILLAALFAYIIKHLTKETRLSNLAKKWASALVYFLCLVLALLSLQDGLAAVNKLSRDGVGFNHSGWRNSTVITTLREMPSMMLYSNRPTAIYLLTGKGAYVIPTPIDPATTLERPNFEADLEEMQNRVKNGEAALVLFGMKTDPETAELFEVITESLPVFMDLGREQIFAISLPTIP